MAFEVFVSEDARADLYAAADYIAQDSEKEAERWLDGVWELILSLDKMPNRFGIIAEAPALGADYRSAPFHSHRVIYRTDEAEARVFVVRVYHMARMPLRRRDL